MDSILLEKKNKKIEYGLHVMLGVSMIFPEYLAPFFIFGLYIYFIKNFKKSGRKAKMGDLGKVAMIYMGYMVISCIWSETHVLSALIGLLWMGCFLGYVLIANVVNTEEKLKTAITAVNIGAGIIGLIAVIEIVTFNLTNIIPWFNFKFPNPLFYDINDKVFDLIPVDIVNNKYSSRASSTFDNPLILATYLVMATPFCAFGSFYFDHSRNRKISRACFVFALLGLVCTSSRASYVSIAISIVIMLFSNKKSFKKLFPFIIAFAMVAPVGLALRFMNTSSSEFVDSDDTRITIWKSCIDIFLGSPIFGLGAGSDNIHTLLRDTYRIDRTHAHNLFLELLVEGGLVGFAFLIVVVIVIAYSLYKIFKEKDGKYSTYGILYISTLMGFFVMSMTEHTLQSAKELMMFFIVLGFCECTRRLAMDEEQHPMYEVIPPGEEEEITYEQKENN